MRDIEKYIKENQDDLMMAEPSEKHFENFQKKLKTHNKPRLSIVKYIRVASVAILISISTMWVYEKITFSDNDEEIQLSEMTLREEFQNAEAYYTTVVHSKLDQVGVLSPKEEDLRTELLEKEFKEFDRIFADLKDELKSGCNEDLVIQQMIKLYQDKIEFLNTIIKHLENHKQKSRNYEIKQI